MNRIIVLDSGPLGMVTNPKAKGIPLDCQMWLKSLLRRGERIIIPEIADDDPCQKQNCSHTSQRR